MHEDIDDYEPDLRAYYNMTHEERQIRKDLHKVWLKYSNGKMTYEQYLREIDDPYFYGILSDSEWKELKEIHEEEKRNKAIKKHNDSIRYSANLKAKEENKAIFRFISFVIIIILILWGLVK
jgi:hypothetical protein